MTASADNAAAYRALRDREVETRDGAGTESVT